MTGTERAASESVAAFPEVPGCRIEERIAPGVACDIYRAIDTTLNREVVVKVAPRGASADFQQQFLDAARIIAPLQHPGISPIYQSGRLADGRPFLVMPFISGVTLVEFLSQCGDSQLDQFRLLRLFENVCEAMAYIHSRGVIHRNLMPSQILLGPLGNVQVIGWGQATRAAEPKPIHPSAPNGPLGRPTYHSPELVRGEWGQVSFPSDVFMLGAILAHILTGQPPFKGVGATSTPHESPGDVSEVFARLENCGKDPTMIALAKRCLSPKPEIRPANAGEIASAIAAYRAGLEERLRTEAVERTSAAAIEVEKGKRRQLQLALLLVVGLFIVWTGAFLWWYDHQAAKWKLLGNRSDDKPAATSADERERSAAQRKANQEMLQKIRRLQLERDMAIRKQMLDREPLPPPPVVAPPPREVNPDGP